MIWLTKKNMPDFYFRGTLVQYWQTVYAEYTRLFSVFGREPFVIIASELKLPLAEYTPTIFDNVIIEFRDEGYRNCIVSVKADTVLGAELVNLYVDIYVEPLKKSGESAYARWLEIQSAWLEKGLIISPAAHLLELPVRSRPKPKKQKSQKHYSSIRKMLENIAYRDDWLAKYKNVPAWSLKVEGGLDKRTANEINKDVGGLIKEQWQHTNVSGDVFANLIFEKYKHFTNLEAEWNKLKNRGV